MSAGVRKERAMVGVTRAACVLGLVVAGALGGCARSGSTSSVSVSNLTDATLRVSAALDVPPGAFDAMDKAPTTTAEMTLEPGSQAGAALGHPGVDSPAVQFVVRVEGDATAAPYSFRMSPPSPFLLRISGTPGDLRLEREHVRPARDRDGLVPADPRERRSRSGYP